MPAATLRLAMTVLLVLGLIAPAVAEEVEDEAACYALEYDEDGHPVGPEFCTQQVWYKPNDTRVGNLGATDLDALPTWDTEEPGAMTDGGMYVGSSELDLVFEQGAEGGATFAGEFTGDIDNLAVELYAFFPVWAGFEIEEHTVRIRLDVDDVLLTSAGQLPVTVEHLGDGLGVIRFVLEGIHHELDRWDDWETGPDVTHTLELNVSPWFIPEDDAVYLFGAEEAPSGMTFNLPDLGQYTRIPV